METVISSFQVFPYLKDFIVLFDRGAQCGELELYPPPCVYREFRSKKHGFGILSTFTARGYCLVNIDSNSQP
jgi:hypothetical protein